MMNLLGFFSHDPSAPWTFLDGGFWLFLLAVLAVDAAWNRDRHRTLRHAWLLLASDLLDPLRGRRLRAVAFCAAGGRAAGQGGRVASSSQETAGGA